MKLTIITLLLGCAAANATSFLLGGGAGYAVDAEELYYYGQAGVTFAPSGSSVDYNLFAEYSGMEYETPGTAISILDKEHNVYTLNFSLSYNLGYFWQELGFGLGVASVDYKETSLRDGEVTKVDDNVFAYQIFYNAGVQVNDHVKIYAGVKYLHISDPDFLVKDIDSPNDIMVHAGVRINF